jgi:hypothetical protein
MRKNEAYPSRYFKAKDFPDDWTLTVEVEMARMEKFENGRGKDAAEKLVVYFRKQKSGLVVGPTVWDQFIEATGEEDCTDWKGRHVCLYRDTTQFGGDTVACIRVRKPGAPVKKPKKAAPKDDSPPDYDDEVPFK